MKKTLLRKGVKNYFLKKVFREHCLYSPSRFQSYWIYAPAPLRSLGKKTLLRFVEEYITEVLWECYETKVFSNVANKEAFLYYLNEIRVFRAVFVICSCLFRDLFVICSWFFRNLFAICSQFVIYSRIVRNLFANCLQIICLPLFTNKANKTRISRSLFAFLKNHECLFAFFFGLFVDTLIVRKYHANW